MGHRMTMWFGFGTLWGSIQVDGIWYPQNPLGLQFWGIAVQDDGI